MKYDADPQYDMISFHFKKVLLDQELIPSIKNFDWAKNTNSVREINPHDATFISLNEYIMVEEDEEIDQVGDTHNEHESYTASRQVF